MIGKNGLRLRQKRKNEYDKREKGKEQKNCEEVFKEEKERPRISGSRIFIGPEAMIFCCKCTMREKCERERKRE